MSPTSADADVTNILLLRQFLSEATEKLKAKIPTNYSFALDPSGVSTQAVKILKNGSAQGAYITFNSVYSKQKRSMSFEAISFVYTNSTIQIHELNVNGYSTVFVQMGTNNSRYKFTVTWPYTAAGVDKVVKFLRNSIDACTIPLLEESVGSHSNCSSCSNQLSCIARVKEI